MSALACVKPGQAPEQWECAFFAFDGAAWFVREKILAVRLSGPPMGRPYTAPDVMWELERERGRFVPFESEPDREPHQVVIGDRLVRRDLFEVVQAFWPGASWRIHSQETTAPVLAFEGTAPGSKMVAVLAVVTRDDMGCRFVATSG